jgi:carbonic anhydrase
MANSDQLLQRNKDFAATGARGSQHHRQAPGLRDHVPGSRTDPSAFPGLQLGDAMVVRNAGGRVPADVLKDLTYIGYLASTLVPGGPRFEVAAVHHTQCGTHFLADDKFRPGFADLIGGDDAALAREAVTDPEQTVRFDVELLRSATVPPDTITVSGHVYDVTTGLVTTIIPAAPMCPRMSSLTPSQQQLPSDA